MAYQQHHAIRATWPLRVVLGTVLLVAGMGLAVFAFRTSILAFGLTQVLNESGLGPARVSVSQLGSQQTILGPITLGDDDLQIESIIADYNLSWALFRNELDALTVNGLEAHGTWTDDGLTFGVLDGISNLVDSDGQSETVNSSERGGRTGRIGRVTVTGAVVVLQRADGPLKATGDVAVIMEESAMDLSAALAVEGGGIDGSVTWNGRVVPDDLLGSAGRGRVALNIDSLAIPGAQQTITGTGAFDVTVEGRSFVVQQRDPLTFAAPWPASWLLPQASDPSTSVGIAIGTASEDATMIGVTETPEGLEGLVDVRVEWDSPMGSGLADVGGWARFGDSAMPQDFRFDTLQIAIAETPTPFGKVRATIKADGLAGPIAVAGGPIDISGGLKDGRYGDLRLSDLNFETATDFRLDGLSLAFDLASLALTAGNVSYEDLLRFDNPVRLNLVQDLPSAQTATLVFGADGSMTVTFDLGLGLEGGSLTLVSGETETVLQSRLPAISAVGYWVSEDTVHVDVESGGGTIESAFGKLTGLRTQFNAHGGDLDGSIGANITLDPDRAVSRPGLPMQTSVTLRDGVLKTEGDVRTGRNLTLATFSADYDLAAQGGSLAAKIGPVVFGGEGIGPSDIAPLALPVTVRSGDVFADLAVPLGAATGPNEGSVLIRDLDLDFGDYRFDRINAAVSLDRAWPLHIAEGQDVAVGLLQAGVPLTNLRAVLAMPSAEDVDLSSLAMDFAGGRIEAENVRLSLSGESVLSFDVTGVNLTELATLSGLDGLSAEGLMSGTLPVSLTGNDAIVTNGILSARGPGTIRYKSAATTAAAGDGESGYGLALRALEDFRYDALTVTVNGSLSRSLDVGLQIKGHNPAVYDGYPIDFNLNLSGELANVIRGSLTGYRVPETIRRQLTDFPPSRP